MAIILAIWPAAPFCGRSRFATMEGLGSFRRYAVTKSRALRTPFLLLLSVGCALEECLPTVMKNHALRADAAMRPGHALRHE